MDVAILEDLASLLRDGAVHITRNHEELNPNSVPPEQQNLSYLQLSVSLSK